MEHYEIARYGLLKTWARKLGYAEAEALLGETLEEEKRTDALLTEIAEGFGTSSADEEGDSEDASKAAPGSRTAKSKAKAS